MAELFIPKALDLLGPALQISDLRQKREEFKALQDYRNHEAQNQQQQQNLGIINQKMDVVRELSKGPDGGKRATDYYNANLAKDLGSSVTFQVETPEKVIFKDASGQPWEYTKGASLQDAKKIEVSGMVNKEPKQLDQFQTFKESYLKENPAATGIDITRAYQVEQSKPKPPTPNEEDTQKRAWHNDTEQVIRNHYGTLTQFGIVLNEDFKTQYDKALSVAEKYREQGLDPNAAAAAAVQEAEGPKKETRTWGDVYKDLSGLGKTSEMVKHLVGMGYKEDAATSIIRDAIQKGLIK